MKVQKKIQLHLIFPLIHQFRKINILDNPGRGTIHVKNIQKSSGKRLAIGEIR